MAVITAIDAEWIEWLTGLDPDGGSGALEHGRSSRLAERDHVVRRTRWHRLADQAKDFPGNAVTGGVQTPNSDVALAWTASNDQANGAGHDFKQSHVCYVEVNIGTNSVVREIPVW
jgi:hypothetical protein